MIALENVVIIYHCCIYLLACFWKFSRQVDFKKSHECDILMANYFYKFKAALIPLASLVCLCSAMKLLKPWSDIICVFDHQLEGLLCIGSAINGPNYQAHWVAVHYWTPFTILRIVETLFLDMVEKQLADWWPSASYVLFFWKYVSAQVLLCFKVVLVRYWLCKIINIIVFGMGVMGAFGALSTNILVFTDRCCLFIQPPCCSCVTGWSILFWEIQKWLL